MPGREVNQKVFFEFVKREVPEYGGEITLNTRVGEDLRLIGDDASEFLTKFSKKFHVDLSALYFSEYFPAEGSSDMHLYFSQLSRASKVPIISFFRALDKVFWSLFAEKKSFKTMTLEDIYLSAKSGVWMGDSR